MITNDILYVVYTILFLILFLLFLLQLNRLVKLKRIVFMIKSSMYLDLLNIRLRALNNISW